MQPLHGKQMVAKFYLMFGGEGWTMHRPIHSLWRSAVHCTDFRAQSDGRALILTSTENHTKLQQWCWYSKHLIYITTEQFWLSVGPIFYFKNFRIHPVQSVTHDWLCARVLWIFIGLVMVKKFRLANRKKWHRLSNQCQMISRPRKLQNLQRGLLIKSLR